MEKSKLMAPLFYGNSFNREGHKMRAVFLRELSNGTTTYRLWRSARKSNATCPRAENDTYILHVELNGYLIPLGLTEFDLISHCGVKPVEIKLYGGFVERGRYFDRLRKSGGNEAVEAALDAEKAEIERIGGEPVRQANYIQEILNSHVSTYLTAKENGGETFPDFCGAVVVNDLAKCAELAAIHRMVQREKDLAHAAQVEREDKAFCEEHNQKFQKAVSDAIQIIRNGGVLKNETVEFYRSRYDSSAYSIFNYLMRLYQVDVPLRTQGWINEKLVSATIGDGRCEHLRYLKSKGARVSQKFFDCMSELIRAVIEQVPEQAMEEKTA